MRAFCPRSRHVLPLLLLAGVQVGQPGDTGAQAVRPQTSPPTSLRVSAGEPVTLAARCGVPGMGDPVAAAVAEAVVSGPAVLGPVLDSLEAELEVRQAHRSDDPQARYRVAVVLGGRVETLEGRERLEAAEALYQQSQRVLEVEPEHPGTHHLLGRLMAGVLRLGGFTRSMARMVVGGELLSSASWPVARAHLERGEQGAPCVPEHHLELARLLDETGQSDAARRELRHVLALVSGGHGMRLSGIRERALVMLRTPSN